MAVYVVTLAAKHSSIAGGQPANNVAVHEGHLDIEGGALIFSPHAFEQPTAGYAPGAWIRFEKREA